MTAQPPPMVYRKILFWGGEGWQIVRVDHWTERGRPVIKEPDGSLHILHKDEWHL